MIDILKPIVVFFFVLFCLYVSDIVAKDALFRFFLCFIALFWLYGGDSVFEEGLAFYRKKNKTSGASVVAAFVLLTASLLLALYYPLPQFHGFWLAIIGSVILSLVLIHKSRLFAINSFFKILDIVVFVVVVETLALAWVDAPH